MSNTSFEEFWYIKDNKLHNLSEVQEEYKENNGDISKYLDKMYCPECKRAKLSFTHKTSSRREFLSKIPSSAHTNSCSFNHNPVTKSEIKKVTETLSDAQIQDRLEAALNQLLPKKANECSVILDNVKTNPFIIEVQNEKDKKIIRKSIPRKSINALFDKSEENKIYIFYGRVKFKEINSYMLIAETINIYNVIKETIIYGERKISNIKADINYDVAILGHIKFYKGDPQISLEKSTSMMFRESKIKK